ncbi:MAG: hypothetical protein KF796_19420 [Ramlibacter sp.]|nr:hypothetical protein [Ramlibacter sp.]
MRWNILDGEGNVINSIEGDADFVAAHYPGAVPAQGMAPAPEPAPPAPPPAPAPEPDHRPRLVVTEITSSNPGATTVQPDLAVVRCPVGTTLTINAQLRAANDSVIPITSTFLMPVRSRDGRERVLPAPMVAGLATVVAPFAESGVWRVTEQEINSDLPALMQMQFAGIQIFVFLLAEG